MPEFGEIGRIPKEWARCLLPLVRDKKVKIEGHCKTALDVLSIMDTIDLSVRVYINSAMFVKRKQTSLKAAGNSNEKTVVHPLPTLFQLLGLTPFKKAEFTPGDLYMRKRMLNQKFWAFCLNCTYKESISDAEIDNSIVGVGDSSELQY